MKKILLDRVMLDTFIEWKSQGVLNGRIAGILGIHPNTLSNWISKGKELAIRIEEEEDNFRSLFNENEYIMGIKNEYLYKLYLENDKQYHVACAKSEARAIKTGNIGVHMNVVRLLEASKGGIFIIPEEENKPPILLDKGKDEIIIEFKEDEDIRAFLNKEDEDE